MKLCKDCSVTKDSAEFYKSSSRKDGLQTYCKDCMRIRARDSMRNRRANPERQDDDRTRRNQWRRDNLTSEMISSSKKRARAAGVPHAITRDDIMIPETCPVLGIPLVSGVGRGPQHNAPTLDRIIPGLGYVPGNIMVMSHLANSMKRDATPAQLHKFAEWILKEVV